MRYFNLSEYCDRVQKLRKTRRLHPEVLARLKTLLSLAFPSAHAVPEVNATPGGRNDLIQFFHDGRRTVFELFATEKQVPQDLRLLEQCPADSRVAILLDVEVDSSVSNAYFRKRPNHFPFIWLRIILEKRWEDLAVALLRELTDDSSSIQRIRRLLASPYGRSIDTVLSQLVDRIEKRYPRQKEALRQVIIMDIK
jgi:hypothetical protein